MKELEFSISILQLGIILVFLMVLIAVVWVMAYKLKQANAANSELSSEASRLRVFEAKEKRYREAMKKIDESCSVSEIEARLSKVVTLMEELEPSYLETIPHFSIIVSVTSGGKTINCLCDTVPDYDAYYGYLALDEVKKSLGALLLQRKEAELKENEVKQS